jgi:hypothetical protein
VALSSSPQFFFQKSIFVRAYSMYPLTLPNDILNII